MYFVVAQTSIKLANPTFALGWTIPLMVMPVQQKYISITHLWDLSKSCYGKDDTISLFLCRFFIRTERPVQYGEYVYGAEISMVTYIYIITLWEYKCGMIHYNWE